MPTKRFLLTAAPLAILALAGMGLATAQSSSPFAPKTRAQAWDQAPAAAVAAGPQSWSAPSAPVSASLVPSIAPTPAPYQAPVQYEAPSLSSDAPIATRPRRSTKMQAHSTKTPPKTYGGRPAQPQVQSYPSQAYAGSSVPPAPRSAAPQRSAPRAPAPQSPAKRQTPNFGRAQAGLPNTAPPRRSDYIYTPPNVQVAQAPDFGSPVPPTGQASPQTAPTSGSPYAPQSGRRPQAWETQGAPSQPAPNYQNPAYQGQGYQNQGQAYPNQGSSQTYGGASQAPSQTPPTGYTAPNGYTPNGYSSSVPPTGAPYPGGPFGNNPQRPRSWTEKLGLKNIATLLRGKLTLGGAATNRDVPENQLGPSDGWTDSEIADAELEFEASAITEGGLEYGVALGVRAQYDEFRRGFGGQLPECPPGITGCSGSVTGLRGHSSGFYSGGEDITKDAQIALESAHLFLRSAYGDVTIGRDDGAAYLFSLGAPSLLAVGASNSPVDYTGLDSVKTVNDASGFAEKVTYTSPRLLGDQIGFGVQLGASYALDGDVCGVDYCNGRNIDGILQPEIEDIFEVGVAIDRTFGNGLRAELTGTYANGSEQTGGAEFDDLESFGVGVEFEYGQWTLGSSYLDSNNGLLDGDYTAYDVGLTWKPNALGFTLGYGHAEDDNVGLESDQAVFGVTYDFDKFTLGTGVQYVDRSVNGLENGLPTTLDQKATSVFIQGGFKF